ncbi:MAG: hypothetical protein KatS3mg056_1911 [Chloroflexus sp.]|nr:MAG: hypothetical protein KatS3mg056_1911 [Chloroflexus sp.]
MHYPQLMLFWTTGQVTVRRSSRASTCCMNCLTRSSYVCRTVWSAAAMLPCQPYSRSGADCSGLPCRYVTLMMGMAERRPAACPTACWCRWCVGTGSVGAGSVGAGLEPAPTDDTCTVHLIIQGIRWMGMSCIFFAHSQRLSHCARSWALSRCIAVAWVARHEWAADGRSGSGGRRRCVLSMEGECRCRAHRWHTLPGDADRCARAALRVGTHSTARAEARLPHAKHTTLSF